MTAIHHAKTRTTSKLDGELLPTVNRLEATQYINGFMVVKATGEIIEEPYSTGMVSGPSHSEEAYHRITAVLPEDFTSTHQMSGWLDAVIDKRKLIHKNDVVSVHDQTAGLVLRNGGIPMFSVPEFRKLDRIVKALSYRNVLIGTTEGVAEALDVSVTHLQRDLKGLVNRGIVKFFNARSGMAKGMVKIIVSPLLGWKHESINFDLSRATALQAWYASESIDLLKVATAQEPGVNVLVTEDELFPVELVSTYVDQYETPASATLFMQAAKTIIQGGARTSCN